MSTKAGVAKVSGTFEAPTLLPLPRPIPVDEFPGIAGMFCYIIKHYGYTGVSLLISRSNGDICIRIGDWNGNVIDINKATSNEIECLTVRAPIALRVMQHIGLQQAIFYFADTLDGLVLSDVRLSLNKFAGPGMLNDIFGKVFKTQDVLSIEKLSEPIVGSLMAGTGDYDCDIILKPSRFRCASVGDDPVPLYVEITRC